LTVFPYCAALDWSQLFDAEMDTTDLPSYIRTGVLLMCRCTKQPFFVARILVVSITFLIASSYCLFLYVALIIVAKCVCILQYRGQGV